jgi:predicted NBD/HSP70 family sugar kinase
VAVGLATITATLDPQIIVLSGDLLIAGGPPLRTMIEDRLYRLIVPRPELRTSTIAGNAVLAGALCAALDKTRSRVFSATDGV